MFCKWIFHVTSLKFYDLSLSLFFFVGTNRYRVPLNLKEILRGQLLIIFINQYVENIWKLKEYREKITMAVLVRSMEERQ